MAPDYGVFVVHYGTKQKAQWKDELKNKAERKSQKENSTITSYSIFIIFFGVFNFY
ncbi:hypothetical protein HanIR_Chr16g0829831 [Helianthus annuus]|nr:hypothetical protein HanIR_Chr16g0829831 [Helianthus annuus]